jgi:hypothetical protein
VQPKCSNVDCDLNGLLPVYTVDEDIYEVRPSVILGTSDKFVALVRNEHSGSLFRSRTGKPPELILQDELHLISGPLGSLAGIFESAIDIICGNGIRPKIIGSTATIKNASDQIQALFDRSSFQFPPFGLSASDSCFALEDRSAPGRLYIGTSTTGRSAKFALQAVAASTYYVGREIHAKYKDDFTGQADTYTTLVSYYNSLKELGGAMVLFQDDVGETLRSIARSAGSQMYSMTNICELTSNRSQDELQSILIDLELNSNDPNSIDACLASNMLSVGVDVSRLGLMLMNGQPKTRSEYIQATSRVGRNYPGIVVTLYNDTKVRDKSAYEGFTAIHENMYKEVEVTSVTPFSPQCLDRALATVVVAACRHRSSIALNNPEIQTFLDVFDNVSEELCERCQRIDSANLSYLKQKLMDIKSIWLEANPTVYCEFFPRIGSIPLLVAAEQAARMEEDQYFLTMITNLRSVESQSLVRPMPDTRRG